MKAPPFLPQQQLVNHQLSVIPPSIPASIATNLPVLNSPQQKPTEFHRNKTSLFNPDLNLWRSPQTDHPNVNQSTKKAAIFNSFQPTLPQNTANSAISHPIPQSFAPRNVNIKPSATCRIAVNPFSTTTNIAPLFAMPVLPPKFEIPLQYHCAGVAQRVPRLLR